MRYRNFSRFVFAASLLGAALSARAEIRYKIFDIGTLPGTDYSSVQAINNSGSVAGYAVANGSTTAFRWNEQFGHWLISGFGYDSTRAYDINDNGVVAGSFTEGSVTTGLTWHNGGWWHNTPAGGQQDSVTFGINNLNQGVGHSGWVEQARATGWLLGSPGFALPNYPDNGASIAFRLNDSGDSVGHARKDGQIHATLFRNNNTVFDLHTMMPGVGNLSLARDINESGSIVGRYTNLDGLQSGFYFNFEIGMVSVGVPGQTVEFGAVNANGLAAGSWNGRAATWHLNEGLVDMNTRLLTEDQWVLVEARDLNDSGWIVGQGTHNGVYTSFLAKPTEVVPEPGTMVAALAGLGAVVARRRANRR